MNEVTLQPGRKPATRHRTPSNDVRAALIDAAERLLETEGLDGLAVRRVALEAGVAPMGVYNHLGGKQGVVDAVFERGFDTLRARLADIDRADPQAALVESGIRYRDFALQRPRTYGVMFDRSVPGYEPSDDAREHASAAFGELVLLVEQAARAGVIQADDTTDAAQQLWSACHGAVSLELRGLGFVPDHDAHHRRLIATLVRGLADTR